MLCLSERINQESSREQAPPPQLLGAAKPPHPLSRSVSHGLRQPFRTHFSGALDLSSTLWFACICICCPDLVTLPPPRPYLQRLLALWGLVSFGPWRRKLWRSQAQLHTKKHSKQCHIQCGLWWCIYCTAFEFSDIRNSHSPLALACSLNCCFPAFIVRQDSG